MNNEELKEIVARADAEYDMLKDRVHELYDSNEELKQRLEDINYYIEQRCKEEISETERAILRSVELISKGIVKVVRE